MEFLLIGGLEAFTPHNRPQPQATEEVRVVNPFAGCEAVGIFDTEGLEAALHRGRVVQQ